MNKDIYLIKGTDQKSYKEFTGRIMKSATELTTKQEMLKIKVVYTAEAPPKVSIIPFKKTKIASVSIYN